MDNLWEDQEAQPYLNDSLQLRIYTSCLLGREPALVLHNGAVSGIGKACEVALRAQVSVDRSNERVI